MNKLRISAGAAAVLALFFVVVTAIRLAPWVTMPDEPPDKIHRGWNAVLAWAATDPTTPEAAALERAMTFARPPRDAKRAGPPAPLTEDEKRAVDSFDLWSRSGAPIAVRDTVDARTRTSLDFYNLAQVVLKSAHGAGDLDRVAGCARLGHGNCIGCRDRYQNRT